MKIRKLVVFDMDGVLVDVSKSYRTAVRETAACFLKDAAGSGSLPRPLFTLDDLAFVKKSGGQNNDWELTYLIISLLISVLDRNAEDDLKIYSSCKHFPTDTLLRKITEKWNLQPLIAFLKKTSKPLSFLLQSAGKKIDPLVKELSQKNVRAGNLIKQIFQEAYLGPKLFFNEYGFKPCFYRREGLLEQEKLIINTDTLDEIYKKSILAIATGRPKQEAEYALKKFRITQYFSYILTLDDCNKEENRIFTETGRVVSLSKPNPFMLNEIAREAGENIEQYFYIGDMPDDMEAAAKSSFNYTGILFTDKKTKISLQSAIKNNNFLISDFTALIKII